MKGSCRAKQRIILHVDMDHFFSAVEEREHAQFKGKPVVVGADPQKGDGRGVVKTCNYEARAFGIRSGMPISKAWRLCPNAVYVQSNYRLYKEVSKRIMAILETYSQKFQQWGVDEAYLDISSDVQNFEEAVELAASIKYEILWNEQLTCSIGIGPNMLVAKIASDHNKPDGLTVVPKDSVERFLAPLPVRRMLWVGEKTGRKLNAMGIETIGDLASYDVRALTQRFGIIGSRYHQYARGIHEAKVGRIRRKRRSLGHENTFSTDTDDSRVIFQRLNDLCQKIHDRVVRHKLLFRTVTVKIRLQSFETHTHGKTLPFFTGRLQDLQKTAQKLAQDYFAQRNEKLRLVGVRVSNLKFVGEQGVLLAH